MSNSWQKHEPVLLKEVIDLLHIENQAKFIDATLGAGGYSREICKKGGVVLGIDADEGMIVFCQKDLKDLPVKTSHANFRDIKRVARQNGFGEVDGIVFDLGISNVHLSDEKRGFSFKNPRASLDMRIDPTSQSLKASDLLNLLRVDHLRRVFEEVLGKDRAFRLAIKIEKVRQSKKFETVGDLLEVVGGKRIGKIHPATKIFLALRIAVNSELDTLRQTLPDAFEILKHGGRLAIVSFHSLEDGIVKNFFKEKEKMGLGKVITKSPIEASDEEVERNPKSRSAKLRVLERI